MPVEIVIPDDASRREGENRGLFRRSPGACALCWGGISKRHPIVERTDLQGVVHSRGLVNEGYRGGIVAIDRSRVHAARAVALVVASAFQAGHGRAVTEIDAIDNDAGTGELND